MALLGLTDIIGPIMVGPSSSHTAGALRIAKMARSLMEEEPLRVKFTLYGSFSHTQSGHGTDRALVAGILGMQPDDLEIRNSFVHARAKGMQIDFVRSYDNDNISHPNTVDIEMETKSGDTLTVRGESIGGGAAAITRIDEIYVNITGEHANLVIKQRDIRGVLARIANCLAEAQVNIATTTMYRTHRGSIAYTVMEIDDEISAETLDLIRQSDGVLSVRLVPASERSALNLTEMNKEAEQVYYNHLSIPPEEIEQRFEHAGFSDGVELLQRCDESHISIGEATRRREEALRTLEEKPLDIDAYLNRVLDVMREAAFIPLKTPHKSLGDLIGGESKKFAQASETKDAPCDSLTAKAATYAMAVLETNASMGRIVAAPTAGSAGVLPGVLLALAEERDYSDDKLRQGLLTAAGIGYLITRNSTVSGAEGGCQAEVGSAAAMAAAAVVEMAGGTPKQALSAASNALVCLMGLVCDPVGGLVEVPCQKRNASAAAMALVCAQMALSGIDNLVNFDETVDAMDAVGRSLPFELRESALGGLAATPSACAACKGCAAL
ncbi:MAG: L-serine ammonia-lyase, iron-sulfur-dependent, subunit alpha [Eggerthellaceae bacterium]|jgi:L-serine dehydratase